MQYFELSGTCASCRVLQLDKVSTNYINLVLFDSFSQGFAQALVIKLSPARQGYRNRFDRRLRAAYGIFGCG